MVEWWARFQSLKFHSIAEVEESSRPIMYLCVEEASQLHGSVCFKFLREAYVNYRYLDLWFNKKSNTSYVKTSVWGIKYLKDINFKRVLRVKTAVDPDNFFRHEHSILHIFLFEKIAETWEMTMNNKFVWGPHCFNWLHLCTKVTYLIWITISFNVCFKFLIKYECFLWKN